MEPNKITFIKQTVTIKHFMAPLNSFFAACVFTAVSFLLLSETVSAQVTEPEIQRTTCTLSLLNEHYGTGFGFGFVMNNFGFGVGGEYRKVVARQTELTASLRITGLRDASEQTFTDFFWGQQVIPNKYQRAMAFPLMLGMRQRVFPGFIQENYRFFLSGSLGVAAAFSYPYFRDLNDNGYREQFQDYFEPVNDI